MYGEHWSNEIVKQFGKTTLGRSDAAPEDVAAFVLTQIMLALQEGHIKARVLMDFGQKPAV